VGPWIGGVPAVIVALTMGWDKALMVAGVIVAMQSLENWFLVPRVMRGAVGLTPLSVFIAILAGTQFMGVTGAVLAIPIAAAVQVILTDYFAAQKLKREPQAQSGWRWMLSRASRELEEAEASGARALDQLRGEDMNDTAGSGQTVSSDIVPHPELNDDGSTEPVPPQPPATTSAHRPKPRSPRNRAWDPFGRDDTTPVDNGEDRQPPPRES
jgi:hypothetical protein